MGMALPSPCPRWPIPDVPGLLRCQWCGAQYQRGDWYYGARQDRCSTTEPEMIGRIPDDVCPVCRAKEGTEPKSLWGGNG